MCGNQIRGWALICILGLLFPSCSKDTIENYSAEEAAAFSPLPGGRQGDQGDRGDGGGRGGNDGSGTLDAQVATRWIDLFLELERYAEGMRPNATARALAYISLAAYEAAVPAIPRLLSNSGRIPGFEMNGGDSPSDIDVEIAVNACFSDVMQHFLNNVPADRMAGIANLESREQRRLSNNVDPQRVAASIAWGAYVADIVIAYSQTDLEAEAQILSPQPTSYEPPIGEGYWTYSAEPERALYPYWSTVRTFIISAPQTSSVPPLPYSEDPGSDYYAEMTEVYQANNDARAEDGEQLWIAEFWSDDVAGLTFGPPSRQYSIANQLVDQRDLRLGEALRLFLKLGFSLNDAAVCTWKYKYEYMVMRPSVFIHEFIDPNYQTNLYRLIPWPNPTFPGYPSGHSCFASAAAGVFIDFFGNRTNFTDRSHEGRTEFRGASRTFSSFEQMAEENAYSRIPLGVHIRMDCTEGLRLGYEIANAINAYATRRPRT